MPTGATLLGRLRGVDGDRMRFVDDVPRRLKEAGVGTVLWATGCAFDYGWVRFPVLDELGYPKQHQGVSDVPGLYFAGLHWLHKHKSGILCGVAEGAEHVARHIARGAKRVA